MLLRPRPFSSALGLFTLLAVRGASCLVAWLPPSTVASLGRMFGRLLHHWWPWRMSVLRCNLLRVLSALSVPCTVTELERRVYEHFGASLMLTLRPPHQREPEMCTSVSGSSLTELLADCEAGGIVICSAHMGVWELLPEVLSRRLPAYALRRGFFVYRPLHNVLLDRWLCRRRERAARMAALSDAGSIGVLRSALKDGGVVGLLADQRPSDGHAALQAVLFGEHSAFSPGLSSLHHTTGAPVWLAVLLLEALDGASSLRLHLERLAPRSDVGPLQPSANRPASSRPLPREPAPKARPSTIPPMDPLELTQAYADALTAIVKREPAQYFWFHRRWKRPVSI